ncbi:MAG TPA: sensor histidine kinase, partial [Bacteroidia bacterium]|nr:sensor histidine kinase [Bacteroidia bacterium]
LKHILFNLISNAIKFSDENMLIEIISSVDTAIHISVKDKGVGIPAADQKHLFERFFRGQNVTHVQGTGLGLNIVAKYVELMNGYITVDSKENTGTIFTINFF